MTTTCLPTALSSRSEVSAFPLISIVAAVDAIVAVCDRAIAAGQYDDEDVSILPADDIIGRVVSSDVVSPRPFPPFRASVMDGFAVVSSAGAGVFRLAGRSLARRGQTLPPLMSGDVMYVTTGAAVPDGADAVIPVERAERVDADSVRIGDAVAAGTYVRGVGSDIAVGQTLIPRGATVTAAHVALAASVSVVNVRCYRRAVVAVLSCGDELMPAGTTADLVPFGGIIDTNRIVITDALRRHVPACEVRDYGIAADNLAALTSALSACVSSCDVVVCSGGVSMGETDFVHRAITAIGGEIHFGRVAMKPGKPVTFATAPRPRFGQCIIFGLPGNPVSAAVCNNIFVCAAIKRLARRSVNGQTFGLPSIRARILTPIRGDSERTEFHRLTVEADLDGQIVASSTGAQHSSRLASIVTANAVIMTQAKQTIQPNTQHNVMLTHNAIRQIQGAANADDKQTTEFAADTHTHHHHHGARHHEHGAAAPPAVGVIDSALIRVGILTISDRCAAGTAADVSGSAIADGCTAAGFQVVWRKTVADEITDIRSAVSSGSALADVLITTGGTGLSPRDVTVDAVAPLLQRRLFGIEHAIMSASLKETPMAALGRPTAGTIGRTLLISLPGAVAAVKLGVSIIIPLLSHAVNIIRG